MFGQLYSKRLFPKKLGSFSSAIFKMLRIKLPTCYLQQLSFLKEISALLHSSAQNQTSQYSLKIRIHYHSSGNKHIHILVLWRRILACQKLYVSPDGGGGDIFLYLIKSFYQSTSLSVSESVCVCVFGCSLTVCSVLVTGWFQAKKKSGSSFSGNPEKSGFQGIIRPIWQKKH